MGTSGAMSTSNKYVKYSVTVSTNWQSIGENYSSVNVKVNFWRTNSGYQTYGTGNCYCKINGTTYSANVSPRQKITNSGITLFNRDVAVGHNADGTKYLDVSAWINLDTPLSSDEQHYGEWLDTIPRASSVSSISGDTIGSPITVNINRASDSFTHKVDYVRPDGEHVRVGEDIGTSCTFTPYLSDSNFIPNSTSAAARIYVYTYSGSTYIGNSSKDFTIYVPSSVVPTINSVTLTENTPGIADKFGCYVQGKSTIKGTVSASGVYGSAIETYEILINGQSFNSSEFTTNPLTGSGDCIIKITDSRDRTASKSISYSVVSYSNPTINKFNVVRCNQDGTENDVGMYAKYTVKSIISDVNNKNDRQVTVIYMRVRDGYSVEDVLTTQHYSYDGSQMFEADVNSEYTVTLKVSDYFGSTERMLNLGTAFTLLDFNANGRGIAIGRVSSENCFQVAMDIKQNDYFNGRRCQYVPETVDGTKSGWFLVLHGENTLQYENYSCLLAVSQIYPATSNQASGIISLNVRIDDYNMFAVDFRMVCGNLPPDRFRLVCSSYTDFYLYIKTLSGWEKYMVEVLSEGREISGAYSPIFKFNSSNTPISGDPGGILPGIGEQPTILYSNDSGTTETIPLSQPYTDFSRIGVYALGQYDVAMDSTYGEIYTSLEYMTLACVSGEKDADGAYNCTVWRTAKIKFSENTITFVTNCASSFVKGDVGYKIGTDDGLKITRVVGYK